MILPAYIHRSKGRHALFIQNRIIKVAWIFFNVKSTQQDWFYFNTRVFISSLSSSLKIDASFEHYIIVAGFMIHDIFLAGKHPSTLITRVGLEA